MSQPRLPSKLHQEITETAESVGLTVVEVGVTSGTHGRIAVKRPTDGATKTIFFSLTCSDKRATHRRRQDFRKFAKGIY
jgi:ABC-type uncharacterized transport system substrate-binding protein